MAPAQCSCWEETHKRTREVPYPFFTIVSSSDRHMSLCFMPWTGDSSSSKQHVIGLFTPGRGSIAQPTFGVQEMEFSSRTLHGRHQKGKGVKATDCMGSVSWASTALLLGLLPPWGPPRKKKEVVWRLTTRTQAGVHCCPLYPTVPPGAVEQPASAAGGTLSSFGHLTEIVLMSMVSQGRVLKCSPETETWGQHTGTKLSEILGSTVAKTVFLSIANTYTQLHCPWHSKHTEEIRGINKQPSPLGHLLAVRATCSVCPRASVSGK